MYRSLPLTQNCGLAKFSCGVPQLDDWLRDSALTALAQNVGRTFVWLDESDEVVAYYTLCAHKLVSAELTRSQAGTSRELGAVLLARLALDERLHGQELGAALLVDALTRIVEATETVAARYVVVDAMNHRAAGFYGHFGFAPTPVPLRYVRKRSSIAADLASPEF